MREVLKTLEPCHACRPGQAAPDLAPWDVSSVSALLPASRSLWLVLAPGWIHVLSQVALESKQRSFEDACALSLSSVEASAKIFCTARPRSWPPAHPQPQGNIVSETQAAFLDMSGCRLAVINEAGGAKQGNRKIRRKILRLRVLSRRPALHRFARHFARLAPRLRAKRRKSKRASRRRALQDRPPGDRAWACATDPALRRLGEHVPMCHIASRAFCLCAFWEPSGALDALSALRVWKTTQARACPPGRGPGPGHAAG